MAALSTLAAVFCYGCTSKMCTAIGCGYSLEIRFTGATAKPGRYQIEVVADGMPSSCQITLPRECNALPICSSGTSTWHVTLSGCSTGSEPQSVDGFFFYAAGPASLDFVVRRDDVLVGGGSAQPTYQASQPNGPECEPLCRQAPRIETVILP